jgi:hypothetical protein
MSESKITSIDKLYEALESMKDEAGCKINPNSVAKRAGVNHSNIYKKNEVAKVLFDDIKQASKIKDLEITISVLEYKVSKLEKENIKLKGAKGEIKKITSDDGDWMQHLTQMYAMNDSLSKKKADLDNQILHNHTVKSLPFDTSSGEVLEGLFNKDQQ